MSSAIATPTDVIKVRMQAKATDGLGGLYTVARDIYTTEGVKGLLRLDLICILNLYNYSYFASVLWVENMICRLTSYSLTIFQILCTNLLNIFINVL